MTLSLCHEENNQTQPQRPQTIPERAAKCGRSAVSLCADVGAASCISARPKGQDLGSVRGPSDTSLSDNIASNIGASP